MRDAKQKSAFSFLPTVLDLYTLFCPEGKWLHQVGAHHSKLSRLRCQRQLSQGFWADLTFRFHQVGAVLLSTHPCHHYHLAAMYSWLCGLNPSFCPLCYLLGPSVSQFNLLICQKAFCVSFLPVKQLNAWWESILPSPRVAWTGHGKGLPKARRQQNNISTAFDPWSTLLSGLNVATHSRCPWDTWIPQHTPKQPGLWPGAGQCNTVHPNLWLPRTPGSYARYWYWFKLV